MASKTSDTLRVAFVMNQVLGWSQNFITREFLQMAQEGLELCIGTRRIMPRDDLSSEELALKSNIWNLPNNPFTPRFLWRQVVFAVSHPVLTARALIVCMRIAHTGPSARIRSFVCFARALASATAVNRLNVDLLHAHFLTAPAETAMYLSALCGKPYGVTAHAMDIYRDTSGNDTKIAGAAYVVTCTRYNAKHLQPMCERHGVPLNVIHHGIGELPALVPRTHKPPFVFLAVGRMVEKKGFLYLIDAMAELVAAGRHVELWFAGSGPLEQSLRQRAEALDVSECVRFCGLVPPNRMTDVYAESDALVMPSVIDSTGDRDGIPNACLEAMAHSMPIVGTEISGLPEVIEEPNNGYLVPPGDTGALAAAMAALMDRSDLDEMGRFSRQIIQERFDLERNVGELIEVMRRSTGKQ